MRKINSGSKNEIYLILDNIRSMYNVGAIFRSAEGARVKKIYLCGITATPPREKIFKTSMGAVDFVDWEYCDSSRSVVRRLKKKEIQIVALEQTDTSVHYKKAKYKRPVAIVVGHELKGVSNDVLKLCDLCVEIPMYGRANSLNVATAAGILLFEILEK